MWGDMSLWDVQWPLLHSGDHIVPRILTVDYTFNSATSKREWGGSEKGLTTSLHLKGYVFYQTPKDV